MSKKDNGHYIGLDRGKLPEGHKEFISGVQTEEGKASIGALTLLIFTSIAVSIALLFNLFLFGILGWPLRTLTATALFILGSLIHPFLGISLAFTGLLAVWHLKKETPLKGLSEKFLFLLSMAAAVISFFVSVLLILAILNNLFRCDGICENVIELTMPLLLLAAVPAVLGILQAVLRNYART